MISLVGRGLLGSGVAAHAAVLGPVGIEWTDEERATGQLRAAALALGPGLDQEWTVCWCAGSSTMRSTAEQMQREARFLQTFLDSLASVITPERAALGVVFLASSAGGIYGRGSAGTITERTAIAPVTEYAKGKLAQEQIAAEFHRTTGVRCLIGRISNLYGSSQNLSKGQGLVSHVCRATMRRTPLTVTVPLDTRRDYVHASDAGRRILHWIETARLLPAHLTTKLLVSGRSATVAEIIHGVKRVSRLNPLVVYALPSAVADSPRYQSFRSTLLPELDLATPCRSLEAGIHDVWGVTWRSFVTPAQPAAHAIRVS